ncbi:MAG: GNAT family N-acetyltransferase [Oscillospiraceae bacterium]|nr:GNAT family N-acetyltransferase [Oscillospiraceae bacterium]
MDITVRKALAADYHDAVRIMDQVQELHVMWRPDIYRPANELLSPEAFRDALAADSFYVCEVDGTIAGVMGVSFRHIETPSHVTRDVLFIDSMGVDERYRGMGVGHAMLDAAKETAVLKKCQGVELQVNSKNRRAYEMYSKYGFSEKSINMELTDWASERK